MVKYRKRRYARRRKYGRKRMRRVRRGRRFKRRGGTGRVHTFKRTVLGVWTIAAGTTSPQSIAFALNAISDFGQWTGLYDQYRINNVKVKVIPRTTNDSLQANERGNVYSFIDYTDIDTSGLTEAFALQNYGVKVTRTTSTHTRALCPAIASVNYRTGFAYGYSPKWKQWIDMSNTDVPHFGLKYLFVNRDDVVMTYDYYITYSVSFRMAR